MTTMWGVEQTEFVSDDICGGVEALIYPSWIYLG